MTRSPKQLLREKLESRLRIKFNNIVKAFERTSYPSEEAKALALKRNSWIAKKILRRHRYVKILHLMNKKRFIFQKTSKNKREGDYLEWLMSQNESDFRREVRMPSKEAFERLCNRIKGHQDYNIHSRKKQRTVQFQAAVVLYRLGISGGASGAHYTAAHCGISVGSVVDYTRRFFNAILSLKTEWIYWPKHEERELIKKKIEGGVAGFPNCLGFIDGSTIPLEFRPKYRDEEFYTRKANFAIQTLAVCDHRRKIRYFATGFFGCTHDSRMFNLTMGKNPSKYFDEGEYMLADSAFACTSFMVPTFKNPPNGQLDYQRNKFNYLHSATRIAIEHCFGIVKSRFGSMKRLRHQISTRKKMIKASDWIRVCVILHNMMLDEPEDDHYVKKIIRKLDKKRRDRNKDDTAVYNDEDTASGHERRNALMEYLIARNRNKRQRL